MAPEIIAAVVSGLLSAGLWQAVMALIRRKPEMQRLDAEAENLRVQTADRIIVQLDMRWEKAHARNEELERELAARDTKIEELEGLVRQMRAAIQSLEEQLALAEQQLASLRRDQERHQQQEEQHA